MLALQLPSFPLTTFVGEGGFQDRRHARRRLLPVLLQEAAQPAVQCSAGGKRPRLQDASTSYAEAPQPKARRLQDVEEREAGCSSSQSSAEADLLSALTTLTEAADLLEAEETVAHGAALPSTSEPPPSPRSPRATQMWTPKRHFSCLHRRLSLPSQPQSDPILSLLPTARRKDGSPQLEPWDPTKGVLQREECADYLRCVSPWVAGGKAAPELRAKAALNRFLQSHVGQEKMSVWQELSKEVGPTVQVRRRMGATFLKQRICTPHRSRMAKKALAATAASQNG